MGNVRTQGSGISTLDYDSDITIDLIIGQARWMAILRAAETNPTLKELADELMVMYELSQEVQKDDGSISGIFSPTESGEWKGIILG
jgi:hypothetical protein